MFYKPIIVGGESPITPTPYVRPADWLDIPESTGEYDDIYILRGVAKGENPFAITLGTTSRDVEVTFDYGDGTVETLTGATSYTKRRNYDYDTTSDSTWTEHNKTKQVVIHIRAPRGTINRVSFNTTRYWQDGTNVSNSVSNLIYEINGNIEEANVDVSTSGSSIHNFVDLEIFNLIYKEKQGNKSYMFYNCHSLQKIGLFDTSSVTDMSYMFYCCTSLQSIPQLDTSSATTMKSMFAICTSLQSIPQLDTSSVTNMNTMFYYCNSLQSIPQLDTSSVTDMYSMFYYCYYLPTIPQLDTSSVTDMHRMFSYCYSLKTIPQLDTSNVTDMNEMFLVCYSLKTIPQLDTSSVTNMSYMFNNCTSLQSIPQLDTSNVTSMSNICNNNYALSNIILYKVGYSSASSITISSISSSVRFNAQTRIDLFNSLASNVNALTRKINIGTINQNKLADVYVAPTSEEHYYILPTSDTEIDATKTYYTYNEITDEYTQVTPDFSSDEFYFEKVISAETKYAIVEAGTEGAMLALDWVANVKGWTVS